MKSIVKKSLALLLAGLILAGVAGCISPGADKPGTEPEITSVPSEAPVPESTEEPSYLGKSVEFDPDGDTSEIIDRLTAEGKVCQVVDHFSKAGSCFSPVAVYAYDSFPCLTGDEPTKGASRADGSSLYVDTNYLDESYGFRPKLITDPVIINAFDDTISALEFIEEVPDGYSFNPQSSYYMNENACYVNTDADGSETVYVFCSSGELVGRGNREKITAVSSTPIPDAVKSFFFAVWTEYANAEEIWEYEFYQIQPYQYIEIKLSGDTMQLRDDDASGFAALINAEQPDYINGFACKTRINCKNEDHGDVLLTFKFEYDSSRPASLAARNYTLYEDGYMTVDTPVWSRSGYLDHDQTTYRLPIQRQIVSVNAFDTQAVLDYLRNLG